MQSKICRKANVKSNIEEIRTKFVFSELLLLIMQFYFIIRSGSIDLRKLTWNVYLQYIHYTVL